MNTLIKSFASVLLALGIFFVGWATHLTPKFGSTGLLTQASCTASTSGEAIVASGSRQILATSSRRAWARITQADATSNTIALSFNYDAPVTQGSKGNFLQLSNGATTTLDFGLNQPFSYTGAVEASSSVGSTNIIVSQCNF